MHWTHRELTRIARRIARAVGEKNPDSIRSQFYELAMLADSADEITPNDVDVFILEHLTRIEDPEPVERIARQNDGGHEATDLTRTAQRNCRVNAHK